MKTNFVLDVVAVSLEENDTTYLSVKELQEELHKVPELEWLLDIDHCYMAETVPRSARLFLNDLWEIGEVLNSQYGYEDAFNTCIGIDTDFVNKLVGKALELIYTALKASDLKTHFYL